ncbi:replication-associated protein RepC [Limosilactobacillus reuteri]|uniref:replication-associated protein RepC n=1 Tax=Limosilactobacillus reuteri TaxID=1598 RepID=UPI00214C9ADC|nr:replication-associated protein RepC [Limosilactobacillus reuteri]MCR1877943.1 replication-associated protein RepC [Limosilactobacillus reuteri]
MSDLFTQFNKENKNRREQKTVPSVEETKPSTPEKRYDASIHQKKTTEKKPEVKKRGKGRPRKNKSTKMIRISDQAVDIINAYKQVVNCESQDDAIIDVFRKYIESGAMSDSDEKVFRLLLELKKVDGLIYDKEELN